MRCTGADPHSEHPAWPSDLPKSLLGAVADQLSPRALARMPPIWREARLVAEHATLLRDPIARGIGLPKGSGAPVFLIPGYLLGDTSLALLQGALDAAGFRTACAGVRANVGCAAEMAGPMEDRLEAHVAAHGRRRAIVIGQSRGGAFGRLLAMRRPDLIAGLITLGTPLLNPLALNVFVLLNLSFVGTLGSLGVPGLHSTACARPDACCGDLQREYHAGLSAPLEIPFLSIYSRTDGVVDYRSCLDPRARHVEVESSHCGMGVNPRVLHAIADELSRHVAPR